MLQPILGFGAALTDVINVNDPKVGVLAINPTTSGRLIHILKDRTHPRRLKEVRATLEKIAAIGPHNLGELRLLWNQSLRPGWRTTRATRQHQQGQGNDRQESRHSRRLLVFADHDHGS